MYKNSISIHAPTGRATEFTVQQVRTETISIHAPTGGATGGDNVCLIFYFNFNPRSHGGSDNSESADVYASGISIHAPTGGATLNP